MSEANTIESKTAKAKKMMLWFGMISITMTFAGLTSAFIISSSRPDWLDSFVLPSWFTISTISIILSSVFFQLAKIKLDQLEEIGYKDLISAGRKINLLLAKSKNEKNPEFNKWFNNLYKKVDEKISSKLYSVSKDQLLNLENIPPV